MTIKNRFFQREYSTISYIVIFTTINIALYSIPVLDYARHHVDASTSVGKLILASMLVTNYCFTILVISTIAIVSRRLLKIFCVIVLSINSVAFYFMDTYQVILDKSMIGNIFNTRTQEALELFHPMLVLYFLLLGVMPALIMWSIKTKKTPFLRRIVMVPIAFIALSGWAYATSPTWLWIDEHSKQVGGLLLPWSYVVNGVRHISAQQERAPPKKLPNGTLASLPPETHRIIIVLVLGESARSANFSAYGYQRETQPYTQNTGLVALSNPRACSTYTTKSLACIFSHQGSEVSSWPRYEPLPSYLFRHGVDVIWRSHNWGEPQIDVSEYESATQIRKACQDQGCKNLEYDEVLLYNLEKKIQDSTSDRILVVLHQTGSHGPSYFSTYPRSFEIFKPVCKSVQLDTCSTEELVNAYDNTIVYTDYLLSQVIKILNQYHDSETALLFVSDHGESLGEFGVYLHGTPNAVAPNVQRDIPFLVWMSDQFKRAKGIDTSALKRLQGISHDNVFHSVIGAFGMDSPIYRSELDIFSPLQKPLKSVKVTPSCESSTLAGKS